jgi:putative flippase GtrA
MTQIHELTEIEQQRAHKRMRMWQAIRYLMVGGFNTAFGYTLFVSLNYLFRRLGVYGSEIASLLANIISMTAAFLAYKWFVFRTRGNYLREWVRCLSVYGSSMVFTLALLPPVTLLLMRWIPRHQLASNLAGAILAIITVTASYFGHKHFSFRRSRTGDSLGVPGQDKAVETRF